MQDPQEWSVLNEMRERPDLPRRVEMLWGARWAWVVLLVLITAGALAPLVMIWQPIVAASSDSEYREFAQAIGMTARYRYLLTPGEYLELKIVPGTALEDVREVLPSQYVLRDEEAWNFAWISAQWVITLGQTPKTASHDAVYAELYFQYGVEDNLVFVRTDAARSPVRYPRLIALGLLIIMCAVLLLVTRAKEPAPMQWDQRRPSLKPTYARCALGLGIFNFLGTCLWLIAAWEIGGYRTYLGGIGWSGLWGLVVIALGITYWLLREEATGGKRWAGVFMAAGGIVLGAIPLFLCIASWSWILRIG